MKYRDEDYEYERRRRELEQRMAAHGLLKFNAKRLVNELKDTVQSMQVLVKGHGRAQIKLFCVPIFAPMADEPRPWVVIVPSATRQDMERLAQVLGMAEVSGVIRRGTLEEVYMREVAANGR